MKHIEEAKVKLPILIIEDEAIQLKTLADILETEDLQPICCRTGQEALTICRQQEVNVAILDLRLPDMNGLELLRRLKRLNPEIKVIINTGYASLESAIAAVNEEAFAYVSKMGDFQAVLGHIHRAFHVHLARYNDVLEKEVKRRTEELSKANAELKNEISQRQEAEKALRESEERYRRLVELSFDTIAIHGDGKFVYVNGPGAQLYGATSPEELIGKPVLDLIHPDYQDRVAARMQQTRENRIEVPLVEEKHVRFDGTSLDVEVAALPITYRGQPAVQVVIRDITERKQLEEQLRQSQKIEAVGRLAGGIAHDFNNLLTVIIGYSEILLHRFSEVNPLRKYVKEIYQAGEQAASLTRQLLAFSRKQVLQPKILVLNHVVINIENMLRRLIGEDIELVTQLEPELGLVKADPGQLEQVIVNLVVNARDAMPQGGRLTIESRNVDLDRTAVSRQTGLEPGRYVLLAISDTGVGMDRETQNRIFEPFFTTKEQGQGTGLGLATVYGIVKQSGGQIQVQSKPGQGATFQIYLPRVEQAVAPVQVEQAQPPAGRGSETILVVEDETVVRKLAQRVLLGDGYTVLLASHGPEALQLCRQHEGPIHLLLTDVVMPGGMNGRELAEHLLALRPEMKVLYMSGYTDDVIIRHGLPNASSLTFLEKPFSPQMLVHKVREALNTPQ